ncbi:MAG: succinyldiaminopimelate transaminase [Actinomycetales bacterium]|nr:succinyldiaminopimelate transaminase [Actinomycetales bacterium]
MNDAPTPAATTRRLASGLPDFPWDVLAPYGDRARTHADGIVDLSVGTPVDPTPESAQRALAEAANAPGYPTAAGRPELREACARWLRRSLGVDVAPTAIVPSIGSKEMVAALPRLLGLAPGGIVVIPRIAYPTYAVGAVLAGCSFVATDEPESVPDAAMVWLNSPGNPTGAVTEPGRMAEIVAWARARGVPVASDECYVELGWEAEPVSLLHPSVAGDSHEGLLVLHSLSKRSNFAGYRFGFAAGDPDLMRDVLAVRKHAGMMVPLPVQAAAIAALDDDDHAAEQKQRYGRRRRVVRAALEGAGFRIEHSEAGLYLWTTRDEPCWDTVAWFADRGVLVTPGDFYGPQGARHIRVAMTATDDQVAAFAGRLAS